MAFSGLKIVRLIAGLEDVFLEHLLGDSRLITYDDGSMGVDTELAFDAVIANQVVKHTVGFAITDEHYGKVSGAPVYRDFGKALAARDGAKVKFAVDVDIEEDEPPAEPTADPAGGGASDESNG